MMNDVGDEVGVLGLGVPGAWAVLGAISPAHHGRKIFWAITKHQELLTGERSER
jgi:hypothetical protein